MNKIISHGLPAGSLITHKQSPDSYTCSYVLCMGVHLNFISNQISSN